MTKSVGTQDISAAADELTSEIADKLGDLAAKLLGRPEAGTSEWVTEQHARKNHEQWALDNTRDWHLVKIAIMVAANIDPTGAAINAKVYGATWQDIADQCGISRQAAHDRWHEAASRARLPV